jgi:UDP-2-acetamido-2,6-beta-L-arabino-hexul-4-ose reductase
MKVLITGADGFIGKNLRIAMGEREGFDVVPITRASGAQDLREAVAKADALIHLAGINRPQDPAEFATGSAKRWLPPGGPSRSPSRPPSRPNATIPMV